MRKKILRKLGKRFSDKYNFKRLLQTTPDLSKRYTKHETAVNSVRPIRQIPIFEREIGAVYHPDAQQPAMCDIEIFGPGSGEWPSRIKYAEQILDVYAKGETAWVVRVCRENNSGDKTQVEVSEYRKPAVTIHYPVVHDRPKDHSPIFNEKELAKVDQNEFMSYFLVSQSEPIPPADLTQCGLIPHDSSLYNSTFHHKEIALLYADSLREIVKHFRGYSI
jgi:hypothetical protein